MVKSEPFKVIIVSCLPLQAQVLPSESELISQTGRNRPLPLFLVAPIERG